MTVAILGTGAMGGAMARTLAAGGQDVVVWNRTDDKARRVADDTGAAVAATPAEAVTDVDVAISMLADRAAVEQVFRDGDGALSGLGAGTVVAEMSTVQPDVVRGLAPDVRERGADIVDAPVSGSVSTVESGVLTIMVGGSETALEGARPVLEILAQRIVHLGDLGTGATMKLAVNTVVHGLNQALSEGLVLAEAGGIDRTTAYDVLADSVVGAPFVQYKRAAYEDPEDAEVAFRLVLVDKDLELILGLADTLGVPMGQATANREVVQEALDDDLGEHDLSALAIHLRRKRGS